MQFDEFTDHMGDGRVISMGSVVLQAHALQNFSSLRGWKKQRIANVNFKGIGRSK